MSPGNPTRSVAFLAAAAALCGCGGGPEPVDLLLRNGTVVDGTGSAASRVDLAVRGGRVVEIGPGLDLPASRVIDAEGMVVAPGIVDMHSHADLIVLSDPETQQRLLANKLLQGVTTLVVGNCGLGVAPATPEASEILAAVNGWMTPDGVRAGPLSVDGFLGRLEQAGVVMNVATLVPHGPVRISAMGLAAGEPTAEELESMRASVARGLSEGAWGLSAGLIYPPGMYSATDELASLAVEAARRDRLFTSHVRGSSETLLDATRELIEIGRMSGARVHHSHLEAVGERFWPRIRQVLELEDEARAAGVSVSHDVFPYTRAATMMSAIFPPWSLEGGLDGLLGRLGDPAARARIREEVHGRVPEWPPWEPGGWPHNLVGAVGWDGILVASVRPGGPEEMVGLDLAAVAEASSRDPFDVVADLMIAEQGQVGQLVAEISGAPGRTDALLSILRHPAAAIVSDAEDYGRGAPHPAHAGAFARVLRLTRDDGILPLEEAIHKMTSRPASIVGLPDRGVIREGAWADLVVFDPERVADRATWEEPRRPAEGVRWVAINGRVVVDDGQPVAGALAGRVLRAPATGGP
jgi:N-acyl-D-aspartate/D-glutamate deacylase